MASRRCYFTPVRYRSEQAEPTAKRFIEEGKDPPGFTVKFINEYIGKGVFATQKKRTGSFLFEYRGELISDTEGNKREKNYPAHFGSFLFFMKVGRKKYCIDATFSDQIGKFANDGVGEERNAEARVVLVDKTPHLALFSTRNILPDEEIRYDYGVDDLPWRKLPEPIKQEAHCSNFIFEEMFRKEKHAGYEDSRPQSFLKIDGTKVEPDEVTGRGKILSNENDAEMVLIEVHILGPDEEENPLPVDQELIEDEVIGAAETFSNENQVEMFISKEGDIHATDRLETNKAEQQFFEEKANPEDQNIPGTPTSIQSDRSSSSTPTTWGNRRKTVLFSKKGAVKETTNNTPARTRGQTSKIMVRQQERKKMSESPQSSVVEPLSPSAGKSPYSPGTRKRSSSAIETHNTESAPSTPKRTMSMTEPLLSLSKPPDHITSTSDSESTSEMSCSDESLLVTSSSESSDSHPCTSEEDDEGSMDSTSSAASPENTRNRSRQKHSIENEIEPEFLKSPISPMSIKGQKATTLGKGPSIPYSEPLERVVTGTQGRVTRSRHARGRARGQGRGFRFRIEPDLEPEKQDAETPEDENSKVTLENCVSTAASEASTSTKRERKEEREKEDTMTKHSEQPLRSEFMEIKRSDKKTEVEASTGKERDDKQNTVKDKKDLESAKEGQTTQLQVGSKENQEANAGTGIGTDYENCHQPSDGMYWKKRIIRQTSNPVVNQESPCRFLETTRAEVSDTDEKNTQEQEADIDVQSSTEQEHCVQLDQTLDEKNTQEQEADIDVQSFTEQEHCVQLDQTLDGKNTQEQEADIDVQSSTEQEHCVQLDQTLDGKNIQEQEADIDVQSFTEQEHCVQLDQTLDGKNTQEQEADIDVQSSTEQEHCVQLDQTLDEKNTQEQEADIDVQSFTEQEHCVQLDQTLDGKNTQEQEADIDVQSSTEQEHCVQLDQTLDGKNTQEQEANIDVQSSTEQEHCVQLDHNLALEEIWRQCSSQDMTPLLQIGSYIIRRSSFYFLKNTLSDELIDGYMTLMVRGRRVLYIDCINATNIFQGRPEHAGLLKNVVLEHYDSCLAVVNEGGGHWILLIINPKERRITYLNSLGERENVAQAYLEHWLHFLMKRLQNDVDVSPIAKWTVSTLPHSKQRDSVSCGVFVLKFAECYLEGKSLLISKSMNELRRDIGATLLKYGMHSTASNQNGSEDCSDTDNEKTSNHNRRDNQYSLTKEIVSEECIVLNVHCERFAGNGSENSPKMGGMTSCPKLATASQQTESIGLPSKKKKPSRPCPFCGLFRAKLPNHLRAMHKDEPDVKRALSLPPQERIEAFSQLRKRGIWRENVRILTAKTGSKGKDQSSSLIRERRQGQDKLVTCLICKAFLSKGQFYKHRQLCTKNSFTKPPPNCVDATVLRMSNSKKSYLYYESDIIEKFQNDDVGKLCKCDPIIKAYGFKKFLSIGKANPKKDEKRKSLMSTMRQISRLLLDFREHMLHVNKSVNVSIEDMFSRGNMENLKQLLESRKSKSSSNSMLLLGNSIKRFTKFFYDYLCDKEEDDQAEQMHRFRTSFVFHWQEIFGDSEYKVLVNRSETRKPAELPSETEVKKLKEYITSSIKSLVTDAYTFIAESEYTYLRDLTVSRLTLFNARRGGEPSRLTLAEWQDAENDIWKCSINDSLDSPEQKEFLKQYKVAYQGGKQDGKLVPVMFPKDCLGALKLLVDPIIRRDAGVNKCNIYLFPRTHLSDKHVIGSDSIRKICKMIATETVTATKVRHRAATLYRLFYVGDKELENAFLEHMGHSGNINKHVYQCPPADKEVTLVGKFLQKLDSGCLINTGCNQVTTLDTGQGDDDNESGDRDSFVAAGTDFYQVSSSQGPFSQSQDTFNQPNPADSQDTFTQPNLADSQDTFTQPNPADGTTLTGESLAQPLYKENKRNRWNEEESDKVKQYFAKQVYDITRYDRKGDLPGSTEIRKFLKKFPYVLHHLPLEKRIQKIHTKLFNERNKARHQAKKLREDKGMT